jgi:hypothetical protein
MKATVYLYKMGTPSVSGDIESPALNLQYENSIQDVFKSEELGMYQEVQLISKDIIYLGKAWRFLHAKLSSPLFP